MLEFAHQEHIKSYYFDSRNQAFELPPLTQQEEADVCVIGAGFFGLSAALELAEKAKSHCVRRRKSRIWRIRQKWWSSLSTVLKKVLTNILLKWALIKRKTLGYVARSH